TSAPTAPETPAATYSDVPSLAPSRPYWTKIRSLHETGGTSVESRQVAGPLGVLVRSAPAVFIQTLGHFRITRNGVPVPNIASKAKKARYLLKILIARRRPTLRDQLIELLWPDTQPAVSSHRLSVLLSTVRESLQAHPADEEPLLTIDGAVSLNPAQVRVDVEDFLSLAAAVLEAHRAEAPNATVRLVAAVGLDHSR
ncbi:MAG: hypothetical protein LC749_10630, partial [Actinobacteria bacterium]|nr:hypothetical protein [Actinomycetota bacterium]